MKRQEGKNKKKRKKKKLKEEDKVKQNDITERRRRRRGEAIKTRKRQIKMKRIGHEIINREMKKK